MNSDSPSSDSAAAGSRRDETSPAETVPFRSAALTSQAGDPATSPQSTRGNHRHATLPEVFGRFRIERQLGQGGMGAVLLAHDTQLNRPVALKVPMLDDDGSGTVVARFLREARAVASLNHPNICQIYDVGQLDGTHFIAMAYIEGRPLSEFVQAGKPQPQQQVAQLIRKVALALHEAHEQGLLHRDLKPANIMVNRRGEPIVMDFGLACRVAESAQSRLTHEGHLIGTPAYMSPEQINDRNALGPATDIYSLGVVMYELLAGRAAFSGSVVSVIAKVLHDEPTPLEKLRGDVSPAIAAVCARAMSKSPTDRFASMKDLAAALTAYLKGGAPAAAMQPLAPLPDLAEIDALAQGALAASHSTLPHGFAAKSNAKWPAAMTWAVAAGLGAVVVLIVAISVRAMFSTGGDDVRLIADQQAPTAGEQSTSEIGAPDSNDTIAPPADVQRSKSLPPVVLPPEPPVVNTSTPELEPQGVPSPETTPTESTTAQPTTTEPTPAQDPQLEGPEQPLTPPFPAPPSDGPSQPPEGNTKLAALERQFDQADRNRDGQLDRTEVALHIINRADKDKDERLDLPELRAAFGRLGQKLFNPPSAREIKKLPQPPSGGPNRPPVPR